jgi:ABC-type lipoprotein release transport system permease subunit
MMLLKLAIRNLIGAGLRTFLNILVLTLVFLAIVASLGLLEGMNEQTSRAMVEAEYGGGQFWHPEYDPYDNQALEEARGIPPPAVLDLIARGKAAPILVVQGTMYPGGRLRPVLLKGIDPGQAILELPTAALRVPLEEADAIPILLGARMAESTGLNRGDVFTLQWRDVNGTIDAREAQVVRIMNTSVQSVDLNQVWLPLGRLQEMLGAPGEATLAVVRRDFSGPAGRSKVTAGALAGENWVFQRPDDLLVDIRNLVRAKKIGAAIIYALLIFLAMIAIFDTQVLSLFHRRMEIGTLMALGMTRGKIISLFVLEGILHGVLAISAGVVFGTPLLWRFSRVGWKLSAQADSYGYALGDTLYPVYTAGILIQTGLLLLLITALVSWIPTWSISSLTPTEALRGRAA